MSRPALPDTSQAYAKVKWRITRALTVAALMSLFTGLAIATPAGLAGAARSAAASTPPKPVRVGGSPVLPAATSTIGNLPTSTPLELDVILKPRNPAALAQLATGVSTPGSPLYHHYLAPGQFAKDYAATPATIAAVEQGLRSAGFHNLEVSPDDLSIAVKTTAAVAEHGFGTQIRRYHLHSGRVAYANTVAPVFPSTVAQSVVGVVGLNNLVQAKPSRSVWCKPYITTVHCSRSGPTLRS